MLCRLAVLLLALATVAPAAATAQVPAVQLAADRVDARLIELTLATPALGAPTHVRVLLPEARHVRAPAVVDYRSVEPAYDVFGWHVDVHRRAVAFSRLASARSGGFQLTSTGNATVTTPPRYRAGARYAIAIDHTARTVRAGSDRRLSLDVALGATPSTATVTITRLRG